MQAQDRWIPPTGTLGQIIEETAARVSALDAHESDLIVEAEESLPGPSLARALRQDTVAILAEVKRRSPSKGTIAESIDAVSQARAYQEGGAAAVSILTETANFGGSVGDLAAVRAALEIPALKKDFHIAPIQLVEARALGASAALLIVRALSPSQLPVMMRAGRDLGLELLVEVRDEGELERALAAGATMIGVNNRDLETLVIDPTTCERLIPLVPTQFIAIAESGVRTRADVERYAACGADAVLVGSMLSAAGDPAAATRAITGVSRRSRG